MQLPLTVRLCCPLILLVSAACLQAAPGAVVPLPEALESGSLAWRTGSELPWFGSTLVSHDGTDAARSGGAGAGESWLETDVTGPGSLTFWVRSDARGARMLLNGSEWDVPSDWQSRKLRLGPGAQLVRFSVPHEEWLDRGAVAMFLDQVAITPSAAVSLGEGADAPGLTWTGSPGAFGSAESGGGISGGDVVVVQSRGAMPGDVTAEVTGPAAVRFRWRMEDAAAGRRLTVQAGGALFSWQWPENAEAGAWFDAEVLVPAGPQTVIWKPDAGSDFLLDAVQVVTTPAFGAAVDQPALTWSGNWLTRLSVQATGGSVAVTPVLALHQRATHSTTITGPAEVSFRSSLLLADNTGPLAPVGAVRVEVDGVSGTARTEEEDGGWRRTRVFVPEGAHTLTWLVANEDDALPPGVQSRSYQGVLDDIQITPAVPAGLAESLDTTLTPQVTAGAGLSGRWRGMKSLSTGIQSSALVCGPLADGEVTALNLPVTGPARLLLSLRGERWRWSHGITFEAKLDDTAVLDTSAVTGPMLPTIPPLPSAEWRTIQIFIPAGAHSVTLQATGQSSGPLLWLDAVGYLPADPGESKIAGAVGMPGTLWQRTSPPGRGGWRVQGTPMAREGSSLAACMDVPAGQSASLETTVTGPGVLAFSWGLTGSGTLLAYVDDDDAAGAWQPLSSESRRDEREELLLPAGTHKVRWEFTESVQALLTAAAMQAWLDKVKFTPSPAATSPSPGMEAPAAVTFSNDWPWQTVPTTFSATGDGDAATVQFPLSGSTWLEMPVTGPGRFGFWWRKESGAGLAAFLVDGVRHQTLPDAGDWFRAEFTVGPGQHTVRWEASGHDPYAHRADQAQRFWLDGFTALPVLSLAEALEAPALTWTTDAPSQADDFSDWSGLPAADTAANPGNDDAAVTGGTRPLTTRVTGPGVVTFRWAEKTVPPQPRVAVPVPPAPYHAAWVGGGYYGGSLAISIGGWWNWNWWYQPPPPRAVFAVNGASRATLDLSETGADTGFATHTIHLGAGTHTLTWQRPARSDGRRLVVESVNFTPEPDVFAPVAAEAGVTAAQMTMLRSPWIVQSTETHDGTAALRSGSTTDGASTLNLEFTGPGELSFWWKGNGTGSADFRDITNGEVVNPGSWLEMPVSGYAAPLEWQRFTFRARSGRNLFSWRAREGGVLWLDEITFTTPQPLAGPNAVAEALDFSGLTWNAPGWEPLTGGALSTTGDVLAGPAYGGAEDPWIETTVTGPRTVTFSTWTETFGHPEAAGSPGTVRLLLNGNETPLTPAGGGRYEIGLSGGTYTVRLVFPTATAVQQRPLLDDVRLSTTYDDALEQTGLVWNAAPASGWGAWVSDRAPGRTSFVESPVNGLGGPVDGTFSLQISGPAVLSFDMLPPLPQPAVSYGGGLVVVNTAPVLLPALFVDDVPVWTAPSSANGWQTVQAALSSGTHTVTWQSGTAYRFLLDRLVITPGGPAAPAFDEALEAPGRAFPSSTGWSTIHRPGDAEHPDVAVAVVTRQPSGAPQLTTSVTGPAWVSFQHTQTNAILNMNVGSATVAYFPTWTGYFPPRVYTPPLTEKLVWRTMRVFVPEGTHFVSWVVTAPQDGTGNGSLQLDALEVTPLYTSPDPVPLAEAMDAPGLNFTSTGIYSWQGRAVAGTAGGDAAVVMPVDRSATLKADVTGPGMLSFRWRQEAIGRVLNYQSYSPSLELRMDNRSAVTQTPAQWTTVEWPVPSGTHALEWQFSSFSGTGIAYIDDVRFTAGPSLAEALDLPAGLTVSAASGAPAPVTRADGTDAVFLFPTSQQDTPDLSMTLTGPGELSFDWQSSLSAFARNYMVLVDGQPAGDWNPVPAFSRALIAVGPGQHVIRWTTADGLGGGLWLDRFAWSPGLPAWAEAAGGAGANGVSAWVTGGKPWTASAGAGLSGSAAVRSSGGWIQAVLPPGPGTLCWWGRTVAPGPGSNESPPSSLTDPLGGAFWSVDWRFHRGSRSAGQPLPLWSAADGSAFLASVTFTAATFVPLPQALDAPAVVFETSSTAAWTGIAGGEPVRGASLAKSAYTTDTEGSWISASFTGPGRLDFSWRLVRPRLGSLPLPGANFQVDGNQPVWWPSNAHTWQPHTEWLPAGAHTVRWSLPPSAPGVELWLDAVQFTASQSVSLAAALENSSVSWTTGGAGNWTGLTPLRDASGDDAAVSPVCRRAKKRGSKPRSLAAA